MCVKHFTYYLFVSSIDRLINELELVLKVQYVQVVLLKLMNIDK